MASAVRMPKLGLTMERGTVTRWLKREGEPVHKGDAILEIETDKIVSQVESPADGTLLRILVHEGAEAEVRAVLAVVGEPGESCRELSG